MKKKKHFIAYILIILCLCGALFYGGMTFQKNHNQSTITSSYVETQLKQSNDLITSDYQYSRIGKFDNSLELNGWTIPLTNKSFLLQYSGDIQYGIQLDSLNIQINKDTIIINTPDIKVLSHSIDESSIQVYDESNNLFNPIQISDYKKFAVSEKKKAIKEAKENGVEKRVKEKTKKAIKKIVKLIPGSDQYKIEINIGEVNE